MQSHDLNTLSRRAASIQLRGSLEAAATIYQHVAAMRPRDFHALSQLAFVNDELGNVEAAISGYRRAVELRPDNAAAHSNLCLALNYDEQFTAQLIFDEHLGWARRHGAQLASLPRASAESSRPRYDLSGERCRLRVGYISADFREHPRTRFLLPVLAAHDHRAVETYCYSDVRIEDDCTKRFRACSAHWRPLIGQSDDEAAATIGRDGIDALIDMSGHTGLNRLGVLARRAAPVQIHYPGYPGTTGLATMDYCLTDALRDPPGCEAFYTEKLIRLEGGSQCYDPTSSDSEHARETPPVDPAPSERTGIITFGCFNRLVKMSDRILDLWAKVMTAVPNSRLMLLAPGNEVDCPRVRASLVQHGIDSRRVYFLSRRGRHAYLAMHNLIDIALDTFPYQGHTTTLDALWMRSP